MALLLKDTLTTTNIVCVPQDKKKRLKRKGMGSTHPLFKKLKKDQLESIDIQMPRATTFGCRQSLINAGGGGPPKYQVTLKYKSEQTAQVVDPLRKLHSMIKDAVVVEFDRILPNTTKSINDKLCKANSKFPKSLFDVPADERVAEHVTLFKDTARERLDDLMTFGGSEESHEFDSGKSKMVSFAPSKAGRDGGADFDKAWTINANASIKNDMGTPMYHDSGAPVFDFSLVEGPERALRKAVEIENQDILTMFGPVDKKPFSREGVPIISVPFIHVRDDESQISVHVCLEHFHAFHREEAGRKKRKHAVTFDEDTPQDPVEPVDKIAKYDSDGVGDSDSEASV